MRQFIILPINQTFTKEGNDDMSFVFNKKHPPTKYPNLESKLILI